MQPVLLADEGTRLSTIHLRFAELAEACASADRWSFLCIITPLRLATGTGSPVNPIAIL